ncbi:MAG: hypothetical protein JO142_15075 [Burkholderiales bacterium]|nr:hypothetical protein [Burkholderiales bacterium]
MTERLRQTALVLHALDASDRHWMLAQLNAEDRQQLDTHLAELAQLGIPQDGALVEQLLAQLDGASARPGNAASRLRAASVETMNRVFADEPSWLVSAVLRIEHWAWRDAFLERLDTSRRDRIARNLAAPLPANMATALLAQIEPQLADAHANEIAGPVVSKPASRLAQRFRAFVRNWF